MPWIEKKREWLGKSGAQGAGRKAHPASSKDSAVTRGVKRQPDKKLYTVDEVARIFKVDKRTVFKWMIFDDDPEYAVIPPEAWFKLPNGHVRVEEWIVLKLLNPTE